MKRYVSIFLFIVIAVTTLANSFLPISIQNSFNVLGTATKTPTRTPTATKKPEFGPSTSNRSTPPDINSILEEVMYFGRGGGGDADDVCKNITKPTIVSEWFDVEQLENVWASSCGWKKDKKVLATLVKPDGISLKQTLDVFGNSAFGLIYFGYLPTAFDPIGKYKVNFSNGEQTLNFEFNVSKITKSGAVFLYQDKEVQIYNFRPLEKVRLFRYDLSSNKLILKDWQGYSVASNGNLKIKMISTQGFFAVVGEKTGEYHLTEGFGQSILKVNTPVLSNTPLCQGAPKSQVAIGSTARVTFTDGTPTRIRKQPSTSAKIIGRLPEGTRFLIVGGHKCGDGYTWWNIELPNGTRGWMAEGDGDSYYLEPMNFLQQICSEPPSRLSIGDQARVARVDGSNMRIRSKPGFSENIVDKVPEGTKLVILNGPKCIDGNNWWFIRTNSGIEGWMTEAQNNVYLLEPVP